LPFIEVSHRIEAGLAAIPKDGGRLHAVPIAWVGGATFPVRPYMIVEDPSSRTARG